MPRIGKFCTVNMDDSGGTPRDITVNVIAVDGLPVSYDEYESSGYSQDHNYMAGQADSTVTLTMKFTTTASTGTHTVFNGIKGVNTGLTFTFAIGNNAAPTTGDPEFEGEMVCTSYVVNPPKDNIVTSTAVLRPAGGATTPAVPAWGTVA